MGEVVVRQLPPRQDPVDERQPRLRAVAHGDRHGAVELDHRRGIDAQQDVVHTRDLCPVRGRAVARLGMHRGNHRLQRVGARAPERERAFDQPEPCVYLLTVPERPILRVEEDDLAVGRRPRRAPRVVQQHQGQQADRLRLGQQVDEQPAQANGFTGQVRARQRVAARCRVAFVEDQVDDVQHRVEPIGQLGEGRYLVRNAGVADLAFGAHDALRQRRGRRQERARDLFGFEPAHLAQRQRDAGVRAQRRVAAGEDQAEAVVFDALVLVCHAGCRDGLELLGHAAQRGIEPGVPPQLVDCLESSGRDQPRARVLRHAFARPRVERRRERVVHRFLGPIEIAEQPNQRGQHAARIGSVD